MPQAQFHHVVDQTYGRDEYEEQYNALQLAGHGVLHMLPTLKKWGFNIVAKGSNGIFGVSALMPGHMNAVQLPYAYVQLPKGWTCKDVRGYEDERIVIDPAGHERLKTSEWYGHMFRADSPRFSVTLVDRFKILANNDSHDIVLEDRLGNASTVLANAIGGTESSCLIDAAAEHGLYKALVQKNCLSRYFTSEAGGRSGPELAPLWDREAPIDATEWRAVTDYTKQYLAHHIRR